MSMPDIEASIDIDPRKIFSKNLSQIPWWFIAILLIIFSVAYTVYNSYLSIERLLVQSEETRFTKIKEIVENPDYVLGAVRSSSGYETALNYLDSNRIQEFRTTEEAVEMLNVGEIDAVIINLQLGNSIVEENPKAYKLVGASLSLNNTEDYWDSFAFIYVGLIITLRVSFVSYLIALIFGLFAGLGRISNNKVFNNIATLYVELIRGIPIIVLIFYIALVGVPAIVNNINEFGLKLIDEGIESVGNLLANMSIRDIPSEWRAIIALSVTYGAFLAEIFRAGIQSIGRGQMEAARSLGMSLRQSMRYVILPQAIRNVLPALANDFIAMVKDSSLVSVLAVQDITHLSRKYTGSTFRYREAFTILTILYLTLTVSLSLLVRTIERRFSQDD